MQGSINLRELGKVFCDLADSLDHEPSALDFVLRTRIERELFLGAKEIALRYANFDLNSLSLDSQTQLMLALAAKNGADTAGELLPRIFELKAILTTLASGDAYVVGELEIEFDTGRRGALRLFSARLRKLADLVMDLRQDSGA